MTRTLYYDKAEQRFVLIVWTGTFARHHKFPKTVRDRDEAEAIAEGLGLDYAPSLKAAA
jgi:hypothetical protein